ncbi:MAG: hypothetical protein ACP5MH_08910 [Thermoproteus sp.]
MSTDEALSAGGCFSARRRVAASGLPCGEPLGLNSLWIDVEAAARPGVVCFAEIVLRGFKHVLAELRRNDAADFSIDAAAVAHAVWAIWMFRAA